MADWFETRFRDIDEGDRPDPAFAAHIRALVIDEWGAAPETGRPIDTDGHEFVAGQEELIVLETEDRPIEDEPAPPRGPTPGRWLLAAVAAVAVVAVVGALLVDGDDDQIDTTTAEPAVPAREVPQVEEFLPLEPGRWFVDVDGDPGTPLRVSFDIPAEGWVSWLGAANFSGQSHIALSTMTVTNLVRHACTDQAPTDPPVGPTIDDLAAALGQLEPFEVTSPPTDVTIAGYSGTHLQLTVPDLPIGSERGEPFFEGCTSGQLATWFSPLHDAGANPFYGYNAEPGRTEDFWILDVDGTRLVLSATSGPGSQPEDLAELDVILESIRIEP